MWAVRSEVGESPRPFPLMTSVLNFPLEPTAQPFADGGDDFKDGVDAGVDAPSSAADAPGALEVAEFGLLLRGAVSFRMTRALLARVRCSHSCP